MAYFDFRSDWLTYQLSPVKLRKPCTDAPKAGLTPDPTGKIMLQANVIHCLKIVSCSCDKVILAFRHYILSKKEISHVDPMPGRTPILSPGICRNSISIRTITKAKTEEHCFCDGRQNKVIFSNAYCQSLPGSERIVLKAATVNCVKEEIVTKARPLKITRLNELGSFKHDLLAQGWLSHFGWAADPEMMESRAAVRKENVSARWLSSAAIACKH